MATDAEKAKLEEWGLEADQFREQSEFDTWCTEKEGNPEEMNAVLNWILE